MARSFVVLAAYTAKRSAEQDDEAANTIDFGT